MSVQRTKTKKNYLIFFLLLCLYVFVCVCVIFVRRIAILGWRAWMMVAYIKKLEKE